jgi:hypothetical protein
MDRQMDQPAFAAYNVAAVFGDMEAARAAIESLELAGVEANNISLLGRAGEEATARSSTSAGEESEREFAADAAKSAGTGAAVGAGVGGLTGFLAGAAAFGIPGIGPAVGAGIWATTIGGAAAGAGVGFTAGGVSGVKESEAWALTYENVSEGRVMVGVHSEEPDQVNTAEEVLQGADPIQICTFDRSGRVT